MAVRALEDRVTPGLAEAFEGEHLVAHAGAQEDATRFDELTFQIDAERAPRPRDGADAHVADLHVGVALELSASDAPKLVGRRAVTGHEVVDVDRGGVASRSAVTEQHPLARPPEREGRGETGGPSSHDDHVVKHTRSPRAPLSTDPSAGPRASPTPARALEQTWCVVDSLVWGIPPRGARDGHASHAPSRFSASHWARSSERVSRPSARRASSVTGSDRCSVSRTRDSARRMASNRL